MKKGIAYLKREPMLAVSLLAALASLFITKPQLSLLGSIDWHTLLTLFMMLTVLEGFKKENIFLPLLKFAGEIPSMAAISFFLIFCVFFSSMFVTNDVSLIIFVPLTILLFRAGGKERYILPVISMENIAAVRGSLLMPFGSPQNLFLFGQSGIFFSRFVLHMLPLWLSSAALLSVFILLLYRKDLHEKIVLKGHAEDAWLPERKRQRILYLCLFVLIVATIVSRTAYWPLSVLAVLVSVLLFDRSVLLRLFRADRGERRVFKLSHKGRGRARISLGHRPEPAHLECARVHRPLPLHQKSHRTFVRRGYRRALLDHRLAGLGHQLQDLCPRIS